MLAEFKKFDIQKVQRGVVTKDCVRKVFRAELIEEKHNPATFAGELEKRVAAVMAYDSDRDGVLTFKDFYDNMLRRVPQEWLNWIYANLKKGVREEFIRMSLEMNGVDPQLATSLINRTKNEGQLQLGQTFADSGKGYIYCMKS